MIRFDGQVAIVTGAGGGMGRAYALELARRGARVLVNDYGGGVLGQRDGSAEPAQAVVAEIRAAGGIAEANGRAVGTADAARAIVRAALDAFDRIDILVNNAGTALAGSFTIHDDDAIERHYATNLIGGHHLMRAVWPLMAVQGYGRILNISSNGALGVGGNAAYAAAKAGMIGLTLDAAIEGRPIGILVNAVMPTSYSRMIEQIPDQATVDWFRDNLAPERVAAAMAWFLSRDCSESGRIWLTGGGRLSSLVMAETGEVCEPGLDAERIAAHLPAILDESRLSVVHNQAEAGARYFAHFPWNAESQADFGPDMERG
ncbi:SDR family NAD(P)-dependent oxidoreductase [Rhizorhabdus dicambivorans]|uniref:Short-chain dehydrogenase n=1 Tax=Rhizorhabdus dicambivorans TaxID=1850238 RepID=A0A2A4FVX3_9SPHN|nr:SDR family NAD(P)-dependent oxidoreductase [Rhizorhabdus dicambivorans]ATE63935.1 short-chain dehydrogenase [Rhizorhabdus dicambivorans]PCE41541.1 short-chain dehydrogenase [Rhizorhabdus dicambivorans]